MEPRPPPIVEQAARGRPPAWPRRGANLGIPWGPRPASVTLASALYALAAVANAATLAVTEAPQARAAGLLVPLVVFCAALAATAWRVRPSSKRRASFPWIFAYVVLHALVGLLGSLALLIQDGLLGRGSWLDFLLLPALILGTLGWVPMIPLCALVRRGGPLLLASTSWLLWLLVAAALGDWAA